MHLVLIVAILLIVVGPGKLPDVGAALGRAAHDFRAQRHRVPCASSAS